MNKRKCNTLAVALEGVEIYDGWEQDGMLRSEKLMSGEFQFRRGDQSML